MSFNPSNIEDHFSFYLKRMGIDETEISDEEYKNLKNAFLGGCTSIILCTMSPDPGDERINIEIVLSQLENHWEVEELKDIFKID